jgi:CIC family chloride channel protein
VTQAPTAQSGSARNESALAALSSHLAAGGAVWLPLIAVLIGTLTALANVLFHWAVDRAHRFFWSEVGGLVGLGGLRSYDIFVSGLAGVPDQWWWIPAIPILGMLAIALLDRWFPGEIKGYGLPKFLELVNIKGGYLRRRWITLKTLASAITVGCGMSAGIEGPIAQIGGSVGSTIGRTLRPSFDRLRVMIACGSAAAISASFGSPIAGVMFAQEIVLVGELATQSFYLIVLAAGASTVTSLSLSGNHAFLVTPEYHWPLNRELLFFVLMGLLAGILAVFFIRSFYWIRDACNRTPIHPFFMPLLGGLVVGTCLIFFPQVSASGYDTMNAAFLGDMSAELLVCLVFVKILMTGVTLGSGGAGGVFAPSMFIGVVFGAAFAGVVNRVLPGAISEPGSFALVGMGAFLAGATHAPMTAIFLLFELTRDYNAVVPGMITCVLATLMARRILPDSIDTYDLSRSGLDLHAGSEANILRQLHVRSLVTKNFRALPESMPLADFVRLVTTSHHTYFPVVDNAGLLVGIVSIQDLRGVLLETDAWPYLVLGELAHRDVATVREDATLYEAMRIISAHGWEQLPVVDDATGSRVVGMLRRADLQDFYQKRLLARELDG